MIIIVGMDKIFAHIVLELMSMSSTSRQSYTVEH